jgi:tol-pal system protein YbgF
MKTRITTAALLLASFGVVAPALAQNREHVQMAAELRILQEQTQQLALTLAQIGQALTALDARLDARFDARFDELSDATRRNFADQRVLITDLANDLRVVRERTQENNARVGTLREELESLRQTVLSRPVSAPPAAPAPAPAFDPFAPGASSTAPGASAPPPTAAAPPPTVGGGMPPGRLFDAAWADYAGGQYTLAIIGFEQYVRSYPTLERADLAQLLIGDSYYQMSQFEQAVTAYNEVIQRYPSGSQIAAAYYKRGLAQSQLGRNEEARASWELVLDRYPTSDVAGLARQGLQRLSDRTAR